MSRCSQPVNRTGPGPGTPDSATADPRSYRPKAGAAVFARRRLPAPTAGRSGSPRKRDRIRQVDGSTATIPSGLDRPSSAAWSEDLLCPTEAGGPDRSGLDPAGKPRFRTGRLHKAGRNSGHAAKRSGGGSAGLALLVRRVPLPLRKPAGPGLQRGQRRRLRTDPDPSGSGGPAGLLAELRDSGSGLQGAGHPAGAVQLRSRPGSVRPATGLCRDRRQPVCGIAESGQAGADLRRLAPDWGSKLVQHLPRLRRRKAAGAGIGRQARPLLGLGGAKRPQPPLEPVGRGRIPARPLRLPGERHPGIHARTLPALADQVLGRQ